MKLICEYDFSDYDIIIEQTNPNENKSIRVKGPYIVANKKNANGRTYDEKLLTEKVIPKFISEKIKTGDAMGELNHPPHIHVNPERVCHRILNLSQDKNIWIGESVILASSPDGKIKGTPLGDIFASIVQHGGRIGMSTRGIGDISEGQLIDKEYELITVDAVTNPSGPGCFVNGILESKEFMISIHGEIIEQEYAKLENGLANIPTHTTKTQEGNIHVVSILEEFIRNLK